MRKNIDNACRSEPIVGGDGMNVFRSDEIQEKMTLDESFRSNSFVVMLMVRGSLVFNNNFIQYELVANDVYLVAPGTLFELKSISEDAEFISMGFKKAYLKQQGVFLNGAEIVRLSSSDFVQKFSIKNDELMHLVDALTSLKRKVNLPPDTTYLKEMIKHSFISTLYEILSVYNKHRVYSSLLVNRQDELTSAFLNLLSEQFKVEKRVQYYAAQLFVSPRHLSIVVKMVTGKTAGEIIDDMVVNEAKLLLSSHAMNVAQVANELNFSDQSFFGKFFKRHTGFSPSNFKSTNTVAVNAPF